MNTTEFIPPTSIDLLAVFLWATSGAIVGRRKGYDIVGVFVIAFVSSTGGSLIRDGLFLQRIPPVFTNLYYLPIMLLAVALVVVFGRLVTEDHHWPKIVAVIDALAVPMFAVLGAQLAQSRALPLPAVIVSGIISGVGGGLLRDLLAGDTPELLRPGQYNTLLVFAAVVLYLLLKGPTDLTSYIAGWITVGLYFVARLLTIRYNWRTRPVSDYELDRTLVELTRRVGRLPWSWSRADKDEAGEQ